MSRWAEKGSSRIARSIHGMAAARSARRVTGNQMHDMVGIKGLYLDYIPIKQRAEIGSAMNRLTCTMTRWIAAGLLLYCSAHEAQARQPSHIPRVGLLATGDQFDDGSERFDAFKEELSKLGYIAGSNIILERRSARSPTEQSPKLVEAAEQLISLPVDVLVLRSTTEALAVQKLKTTIPIIFWSSEPVAVGLVHDDDKPRNKCYRHHRSGTESRRNR
jgi:hypothetical protein